MIIEKKKNKGIRKKWTKDLLNFELFVIYIKDLRSHFDPTVYSDSELCLAELMAINDELKKKHSKDSKDVKKL